MNELIHWLNMGGYAAYVWSAYGFAGMVVFGHIIVLLRQKKRTRLKLQQWFKS